MKMLTNHIILIGFKHVGKSVIGKNLANQLHMPFIDLDHLIESLYESEFGIKYACRQIMQAHGIDFFRNIETQALHKALSSRPAIISVGGGTPISLTNQQLLQTHFVVHVTAPRGIVFERIMVNGRPAFFNPEEDPLTSFNHFWNERETVYRKLKTISVENNASVALAVNKILHKLHMLKSR